MKRLLVLFLVVIVCGYCTSVSAQSVSKQKENLKDFYIESLLGSDAKPHPNEEGGGEITFLPPSSSEVYEFSYNDILFNESGFGLGIGPTVLLYIYEESQVTSMKFNTTTNKMTYRSVQVIPRGLYLMSVKNNSEPISFKQVIDDDSWFTYLNDYLALTSPEEKDKIDKPQESQQKQVTQQSTRNQPVKASEEVIEEPGRYNEIKIGMPRDVLVDYGVNEARYKSQMYKDHQGTYEVLSPKLSFDQDDPIIQLALQMMPHKAKELDEELLRTRPRITIRNGKVSKIEYNR